MAEKPRKRSEVPEEARWRVEDLYGSADEWEGDFVLSEAFPSEAARWAGRLGESPRILREAVEELLSQHRMLEKLQTWANMKRDEDLSNSLYSGLASRIGSRIAEVAAAAAYFRPELLSMPEETMDKWMETGELAPYATWLSNILRYRPHTLTDREEKLLAGTGEIIAGFADAFGKP